jgi:hypothetical protein
MNKQIDDIYQQVINEDCADPLYRFAELVRQDEREQAEKQEPVAWMLPEYGDVLPASEADGTGIYTIPLYTAPPKQDPVAWRKKVNGVWHYFDESTPFPFDDCEPLYEKN